MDIQSWLGCGVVVAVVTAIIDGIKYAVRRREKKNDKKDDTVAAIRFCLLGEFERYCAYLENAGDRPTAVEFNRVQEMYDLYKNLGGDGYADRLFNVVQGLYNNKG